MTKYCFFCATDINFRLKEVQHSGRKSDKYEPTATCSMHEGLYNTEQVTIKELRKYIEKERKRLDKIENLIHVL